MTQKLTIQELAAFAGVTDRQVNRWRSEGLPVLKVKRGNAFLLDSGEAWEWIQDRARQGARSDSDGVDWTLEKRRLEVETMRGDVINRDQVVAEWESMLLVVRKAILSIANRIAPLVGARDELGARVVISDECKRILRELVEYDDRRDASA